MIIDNVLFVDRAEYEDIKELIVLWDIQEFIFWFRGEYEFTEERKQKCLESFDVHRRALKMLRINGNRQVVIYNKK